MDRQPVWTGIRLRRLVASPFAGHVVNVGRSAEFDGGRRNLLKEANVEAMAWRRPAPSTAAPSISAPAAGRA